MAFHSGRFPLRLPPISPARVWSFLAGGKDHFAQDRDLAHRMLEVDPDLSHQVEASHRWVGEAVVYMGQAGIRQLLDLGTGHPYARLPLHTRLGHRARGVYVDYDPTVIAQGRALNGVFGSTWLGGDLRDPHTLIHGPGGLAHLLDPAAPVVVTASLVFQHLGDQQVVEVCAALAGLLSSGSMLVLAHPTGERVREVAGVYNAECARHVDVDSCLVVRAPDQVRDLVAKAGWAWTPAVVPVADRDQPYVSDLHTPDGGGSRLSTGIATR